MRATARWRPDSINLNNLEEEEVLSAMDEIIVRAVARKSKDPGSNLGPINPIDRFVFSYTLMSLTVWNNCETCCKFIEKL